MSDEGLPPEATKIFEPLLKIVGDNFGTTLSIAIFQTKVMRTMANAVLKDPAVNESTKSEMLKSLRILEEIADLAISNLGEEAAEMAKNFMSDDDDQQR